MDSGKTNPLRVVVDRKDWLTGWMEYSSILGSPELWCRWAGISLVAGALEQRVWAETNRGRLYPNQYVVLVGPPGTGKTVLTSSVRDFWSTLRVEGNQNSFHIAATSVSAQSLLDEVNDAKRSILIPGQDLIEYNSLSACMNELSTFLADYENIFMSTLQELYDGKAFGERKRTGNRNYVIERPQLNLLAGCTPGYLASNIPEAAWDQGFLARTILAYSGDIPSQDDIFTKLDRKDGLRGLLEKDLQRIYSLFGPMDFTEVSPAIHKWYLEGMPPVPEHPKLVHYSTRRRSHLIKLCMIASASESDSRVVTLDHLRRATGWLLDVEKNMSEMFKALVVGATRNAMEQVWFEVARYQAKEQKAIPEDRVLTMLTQLVDATSVMRVFEVMKRAGLLIEEIGDGGKPAFRAKAKRN